MFRISFLFKEWLLRGLKKLPLSTLSHAPAKSRPTIAARDGIALGELVSAAIYNNKFLKTTELWESRRNDTTTDSYRI